MKIFIRLYQLPHIGNCKTDSIDIPSNRITVNEFKEILSNKYGIPVNEQKLTVKILNKVIVTLTNEFPLHFFYIRLNSTVYLERIIIINKSEQIKNKIAAKKNPKLKYLSSLGLYGNINKSSLNKRNNNRQNLDVITESPGEYNDESQLMAASKYDYIISVVKSNNFQQLKDIIEHYDIKSLDNKGKKGWNSLHYSSFYGYSEITNFCVNNMKCDVNLVNDEGWTPLHLATFKEHEECVRILLSNENIKMNENIKGVGTPLHLACKRNNFKIVSLLVFKADPR